MSCLQRSLGGTVSPSPYNGQSGNYSGPEVRLGEVATTRKGSVWGTRGSTPATQSLPTPSPGWRQCRRYISVVLDGPRLLLTLLRHLISTGKNPTRKIGVWGALLMGREQQRRF